MLNFLIKHPWLGHIAESIAYALISFVVLVVFLPAFYAAVMAGALPVAHFSGREKRDYENAAHIPAPGLKGWYFWNWNSHTGIGFFPIFGTYVLFLTVLNYAVS